MKINKIKKIDSYKSFYNFNWGDTCVPGLIQCEAESQSAFQSRLDANSQFQKNNIIFGDNGTGKTAVVEIIKNLFRHGSFKDEKPENVKIIVDSNNYEFSNDKWNSLIDPKNILFFDYNYVRKNIHIHGDRPGSEGEVKQNATKLLLTLSEKANILANKSNKAQANYRSFKNVLKDCLDKQFNDRELKMFYFYKKHSKQKLDEIVISRTKLKEQLNAEIKKLNIQISQNEAIENEKLNNDIICIPYLSPIKDYEDFFNIEIKKKAYDQASQEFFDNFEKDINFYSTAYKKIQDNKSDDCPVCKKPLGEVINKYQYYFDKNFDEAKEVFRKKGFKFKNQLKEIIEFSELLKKKISDLIIRSQALQQKWEIFKTIDFLKWRGDLDFKFNGKLLDESIKQIDEKLNFKKYSFNKNEFKMLAHDYENMVSRIILLNKLYTKIYLELQEFKNKTANISTLETKKEEKKEAIELIDDEINFLKNDKITEILINLTVNKRLKKLKKLNDYYQNKYTAFLASNLHQNQLIKMQKIIKENFQVNIDLILKDNARSGRSEMPFDFEIKKGNKNLNFENLSEGERQIISISFFIASLKDLPNKRNIILVFDDPVTSMDARNLKLLTDLLKILSKEFSQLFVFTHHDLFYKYCCKNLKSSRYGLIKNTYPASLPDNNQLLEQSVIYRESDMDVRFHLSAMKNTINDELSNGNFNYEIFVLKYGQFLRYAIEDFIKNDLLHWGWKKDKDFCTILDKLKSQNRCSDSDLDKIKLVYDFCNWSNTLHVDKQGITSYEELKIHIDNFLTIYNSR